MAQQIDECVEGAGTDRDALIAYLVKCRGSPTRHQHQKAFHILLPQPLVAPPPLLTRPLYQKWAFSSLQLSLATISIQLLLLLWRVCVAMDN